MGKSVADVIAQIDSEFVNVEDGAKLIGVSKRTMYRLVQQGEFEGERGRCNAWRLRVDSIREYLQRSQRTVRRGA